MAIDKSSTCCGKSASCVCGARCSCRARPAGGCNCDRATTENANPAGETCSCGRRSADACTCEKAADGAWDPSEHETDFTTKR
ncbi:hypothetical protein HYQ44_006286 [Verticillium longisporum]|nr:hypothetical protein HYQ44_006286 [Verticillium longisporum]